MISLATGANPQLESFVWRPGPVGDTAVITPHDDRVNIQCYIYVGMVVCVPDEIASRRRENRHTHTIMIRVRLVCVCVCVCK